MTTKPFRVLLAAETPTNLEDFNLHFKSGPMFASYKIDGIRAHRRDGALRSRTMNVIPSAYAQEMFNKDEYEGYDGELLVPKQYGPTIYHDTYSAVQTHGCRDPLRWYIFDHTKIDLRYEMRYDYLHQIARKKAGFLGPEVILIEQVLIKNLEEALEFERQALDQNYEGIILRKPNAPYKQNRSTFNQGYLLKLARWLTSEAEIIGFNELMHNDNPAEIDARGFTKRSSHKANLRPSGMLGTFVVRDPKFTEPFNLSGEMDHTFRRHVWEHKEEYLRKFAKYKYKPYGTKEAPRQPIFVGLRSLEDM